jgi:manganese transport protein
VRRIWQLFLGIMAATGGFVDIGELVFTVQAGAQFRYMLLWVTVLGTIGIILFSEMCGRIAAIPKLTTFHIIKNKFGPKLGFATLLASNIVNVMTCAAELGGVAIILRLLFGGKYSLWLIAVTAVLIGTILLLPFKYIERVFGLSGLIMITFVVVAIALHPQWIELAKGFIPRTPGGDRQHLLLYAYFAVGIFSALLMPYEVYFYSSGGIEEEWEHTDLPDNKLTSIVGFSMGAVVSAALIVVGAAFYAPRQLNPAELGSSALAPAFQFGKVGLLLALLGMLATVAGSAVETCLAGAYNFCQFFHYKWGRRLSPNVTPVFTKTWIIVFVLGMGITLTGYDPIKIVEYSVIFAVVVLPLTYAPILIVAGDKTIMGKYANSKLQRILGWTMFALVTIAAAAAIPLMIVTEMGKKG